MFLGYVALGNIRAYVYDRESYVSQGTEEHKPLMFPEEHNSYVIGSSILRNINFFKFFLPILCASPIGYFCVYYLYHYTILNLSF
jgi:hypothetical protein